MWLLAHVADDRAEAVDVERPDVGAVDEHLYTMYTYIYIYIERERERLRIHYMCIYIYM